MFALFAIGYGVLRFAFDFYRAETPPVAGGLTAAQCASLGAIFVCALLVPVRRHRFGS